MKKYFPKPVKTLVAIDGSLNNWLWLRKLKQYINADNCHITFIAVVKSPLMKAKAKKILDLALNTMEQENILYMHQESIVEVGDPAKKIVQYAYDNYIDLVVVGSHNKTAVDRFFMGSVSSNVVVNAPVPVLVMKLSG
jgi:nucleotide-binding universal stress UspA family protein